MTDQNNSDDIAVICRLTVLKVMVHRKFLPATFPIAFCLLGFTQLSEGKGKLTYVGTLFQSLRKSLH
jgi:hypothetical protein